MHAMKPSRDNPEVLKWSFVHEKALIKVWPNVQEMKLEGHKKLWISQWEKHGKFFGLSIEKFFKFIIDLFSSIGPRLAAGFPFHHGFTRSIDTSSLVDYVVDRLGVRPVVHGRPHTSRFNECSYVITEIKLVADEFGRLVDNNNGGGLQTDDVIEFE